MRSSDRTKLLFGPYHPPRLRRGDRATCLFKDCDVVVTGWTDARISWPRCRPLDIPRSHPSLLVDEELARAIRHEAAAALRYWWGVSVGVVWRLRKCLGVGRTNCEGSQRLIRSASEQGAARLRGKRLPLEAVERRRQTALEQNFAARLIPGYHGPRWTHRELALLGTDEDDVIAARIGRTPEAVRLMRGKRKVPKFRDRRGRKGRQG